MDALHVFSPILSSHLGNGFLLSSLYTELNYTVMFRFLAEATLAVRPWLALSFEVMSSHLLILNISATRSFLKHNHWRLLLTLTE